MEPISTPRIAFVNGFLLWLVLTFMHSFDAQLNFSLSHFLKVAPLGILGGLVFVGVWWIFARFMKWRSDSYVREIEERMRATETNPKRS
jgi:hypothetical protein